MYLQEFINDGFEVELDGIRFARITNPEFLEMFWRVYDVEVIDPSFADRIHEPEFWTKGDFRFFSLGLEKYVPYAIPGIMSEDAPYKLPVRGEYVDFEIDVVAAQKSEHFWNCAHIMWSAFWATLIPSFIIWIVAFFIAAFNNWDSITALWFANSIGGLSSLLLTLIVFLIQKPKLILDDDVEIPNDGIDEPS